MRLKGWVVMLFLVAFFSWLFLIQREDDSVTWMMRITPGPSPMTLSLDPEVPDMSGRFCMSRKGYDLCMEHDNTIYDNGFRLNIVKPGYEIVYFTNGERLTGPYTVTVRQ